MRIPRDPYVENIILKIDMAACSVDVVVVKKISQHILIYIIWKNKALEGGGGCLGVQAIFLGRSILSIGHHLGFQF